MALIRALFISLCVLTLVVSLARGQAPGGPAWQTVYLLEIQWKASDPFTRMGKYDTRAQAEQTYTTIARHGGYHQMRIRAAREPRPNYRRVEARRNALSPYISKYKMAP